MNAQPKSRAKRGIFSKFDAAPTIMVTCKRLLPQGSASRRESATRGRDAADDTPTTTTAAGKRLLPQGSASRRDSATRGRAAADLIVLAWVGLV